MIAAKLAQKCKKNDKVENLEKRTNESFKFQKTAATKVFNMIMKLKHGNSTVVNRVSIRLLKSEAAVLSQHLSHIFNLSFKTVEIPEC